MKAFSSIFCAVMTGSIIFSGCGGGGGDPTVEEQEFAGATIEEVCPRNGFGAINVNGVDVEFRTVAEYRAYVAAGHGPCVIWSQYTPGPQS